jgi:hypothetical protein
MATRLEQVRLDLLNSPEKPAYIKQRVLAQLARLQSAEEDITAADGSSRTIPDRSPNELNSRGALRDRVRR